MGKQKSFLEVSVSAYLGVFSCQYLAASSNNELGLHFKLINANIFNILWDIFHLFDYCFLNYLFYKIVFEIRLTLLHSITAVSINKKKNLHGTTHLYTAKHFYLSEQTGHLQRTCWNTPWPVTISKLCTGTVRKAAICHSLKPWCGLT